MNRPRLVWLSACLLAVAAFSAPARSQTFSYISYPSEMVFSDSGNSTVILPSFDAGGLDASGAGTDIVLSSIVVTHATVLPDTFNAPFTLQIRFTDADSGEWTILDMDGMLTGIVSETQTRLKATILEPHARVISLGGKCYLLNVDSYSPPGRAGNELHHGTLTAHVTIPPVCAGPAVQAVTFDPPSVKVGQFSTGTITLNQPAPFDGVDVVVTSLTPERALVNYTMDVDAGEATVSFPVGAIGPGTASVSATYNGTTQIGTLVVKPKVCFDVDDNGTLNIADVARLLRAVAGLEPLPGCN